jgi:uncharacterized repeat protein (TIGR01451 family)
LTANPSTVNQGQSSTLYWSSQNANNCYASGGNWSGAKNISGSEVVYVSQTTSFTITCTGYNGGQAQAIATVFVNNFQNQQLPTVILNANPTTVNPGQASTLTWNSYNANTCYASGGNWSGQKALSGSETVYPQTGTSYSIVCTNSYGSANDVETINVGNSGYGNAQVTKNVLNRTLGQTTFVNSVEGQGLDVLEFEIRVRNTDTTTRTITVRDPLPSELFYVTGSTLVNGVTVADGITGNGIFLENMYPNEERSIRFRAVIFAGTTPRTFTNQANTSGFNTGTVYGTATITVRNRGVVLGISDIPTGAGESLMLSIIFGLLTALLFHFGAEKAGWYDFTFSPVTRVATTGITRESNSHAPRKIHEIVAEARRRHGLPELKKRNK